jgi:hypothetical protein
MRAIQYLLPVMAILCLHISSDAECCKYYTALGECVPCDDPELPPPPPPASSVYFNEVGDKILVVEGEEYIQYMGIDLSKINNNHNKFVISLSGAGVWSQAKDETDGCFETLVEGDAPSTSSDYGDGIYKLAYDYLDKTTVSVIGYPWFFLDGAIEISDEYWGPGPSQLATRIGQALAKMAPKSKLVIIGKSMGGCKMQQVAEELNSLNIPVDLLILVDGSCSPSDQSSEHKPVYTNVKKVFNFRQTTDWPDNDWQNGFSISCSSPTAGHDIDVTINDPFVGSTLCAGVGHNDIDECENLLAYADRVIKATLNTDITSIISLLLLD